MNWAVKGCYIWGFGLSGFSFCFAQIEIKPLWSRDMHYFELFSAAAAAEEELPEPEGRSICWTLHDWCDGICNGYLQELRVEKSSQNKGLGRYLFNHAMRFFAQHESKVQKVFWYAYPIGLRVGTREYKRLLPKLVRFYQQCGGEIDAADPVDEELGGVNFYFDLQAALKRRRVMMNGAKAPAGFFVLKDENESLEEHAIQVGYSVSSTRWNALFDLLYQKKNGRRRILKIISKGSVPAKYSLSDIVDTLAAQTHLNKRSLRSKLSDALIGGVTADVLLDVFDFD